MGAAEKVDAAEDAKYGRLKKIRAAKEAAQLVDSAKTRSERCEAASAEKAREAAQQELDRAERLCSGGDSRDASTTLPEHHVPFDQCGHPQPSAQRNYTDPDSPSNNPTPLGRPRKPAAGG